MYLYEELEVTFACRDKPMVTTVQRVYYLQISLNVACLF